MAKYVTIPLRNLGAKGTVTDVDPHDLPSGVWSSSCNFVFRDGRAERAPSFRTLGTISGGTPSFVYGSAVQTGGSEFLVGMQDGTVERWNARGRLGEAGIETPLTEESYEPFINVDQPTTATQDQDIVYWNHPNHPLWAMRKNGQVFELAPGWNPEWRCKAIRALGDQIIAIGFERNGRSYPAGVKFSDFTTFGRTTTDWSATTTNSAGENVLGNLAEALVDGWPLRGRMYLYSQRSVVAMTPTPTNFVFDFQPVFTNRGVISQNCIVEVDNIHYVFGPDNIWAHDGTSLVMSSDDTNTKNIYPFMVREAAYRNFVYYDPILRLIYFCHVSTHPDCAFKVGRENVSEDLDPYPGCNRAVVFDVRSGTFGYADLPYVTGAAHVHAATGVRWEERMTKTWADGLADGTSWNDLLDHNPPLSMWVSPVKSLVGTGGSAAGIRSILAKDDVVAHVLCGETITFTAADLMVNDRGRNIQVTSIGSAAHGNAVLTGTSITYTAPACADEIATDRFGYTITDRYGRTASANVVVKIDALPADLPPFEAIDDAFTLDTRP